MSFVYVSAIRHITLRLNLIVSFLDMYLLLIIMHKLQSLNITGLYI
jgi:hypothetical protein